MAVTQGPWGEAKSAPRQQDNSFDYISPAKWQGLEAPRREWMVEDCVIRRNVTLLSGDGGKGKSLLMQQLATCAGVGRDWLGLKVKPGRAVMLACEDEEDELWRRQESINRHYDCDMADLDDISLVSRVGKATPLIGFDRFTKEPIETTMFLRFAQRCRELGVEYVIIDTATKTFRGHQSDELQVDAYICQLQRLAIALNGAVILTKHPSVSGLSSGTGDGGSRAWNNSVRSRLYLTETKAGRELRTMKANYAAGGNKIAVEWRRGVLTRDEPAPVRDYSAPTGYAD